MVPSSMLCLNHARSSSLPRCVNSSAILPQYTSRSRCTTSAAEPTEKPSADAGTSASSSSLMP